MSGYSEEQVGSKDDKYADHDDDPRIAESRLICGEFGPSILFGERVEIRAPRPKPLACFLHFIESAVHLKPHLWNSGRQEVFATRLRRARHLTTRMPVPGEIARWFELVFAA